MTRLLVSVRSLAEARVARDGGAHVIDVKEPARGSLGAADAAVVRAVVADCRGTLPLSVALGELLDSSPVLAPADLHGFGFAKWGLAGCAALRDWAGLWLGRVRQLPDGVRPVAVVYADRAAAAPPAEEILAVAVAARAAAVLVDTLDKSSGGLLGHWRPAQVAQFVARGRELLLPVALAGSLDMTALRQLLPLAPDYVAVRGAACRGGREGRLDGARVRRLAALVDGSRKQGECPVAT